MRKVNFDRYLALQGDRLVRMYGDSTGLTGECSKLENAQFNYSEFQQEIINECKKSASIQPVDLRQFINKMGCQQTLFCPRATLECPGKLILSSPLRGCYRLSRLAIA